MKKSFEYALFVAMALLAACTDDSVRQIGEVNDPIPSSQACLNDPNCQLYPASDQFVGRYTQKTDILAVVDNSGSMSQERQAVSDNLAAFHSNINSRRLNHYRFGLVTTDAYTNQGVLQSFNGISIVDAMTSADPVGQVRGILNGIVDSPTSAWEQGLKAGQLALMVNGPQFLRPDADLAVIYLSDEQDYSCLGGPSPTPSAGQATDPVGRHCPQITPGAQPEIIQNKQWAHAPVSAYANYLKGLQRTVLTYTIVGFPDRACEEASDGLRYLELRTLMGTGFAAPICNAELPQHFLAIAQQISARGLCYRLTKPMAGVAEDIVVKVDGNRISYNVDTGFHVRGSTNEVCFSGSFVPQNGATIMVDYVSAQQ